MDDHHGYRRFERLPWTALVTLIAVLLLAGGFAWSGLAAHAAEHARKGGGAGPAAARVTPAAAPPRAAGGFRDSYADVVKVAAPAVVTIRTESKARMSPTQFEGDDLFRRFFGEEFGRQLPQAPREFRERALGSGVIVTQDGYILTNDHVVGDAGQIKVQLNDGRTLTGTLVGSDKPSDLALVRINASDLRPLTLGDSDKVQVGDVVLAVGNPFGLGQTVTMGIVSAKNRYHAGTIGPGGQQDYENFLQTDAAINHGNSGGALVNTKGELIGINSQIISTSEGNIGIGFAIPSDMARNVMRQLRATGHVTRAQLGVTVQPVTSDMAKSLGLASVEGAIVSSVSPASAAARAGLKQGDVISSFDGQPVHDTNELRNRVADSKPGSEKPVTIWRNGAEKTLTVTLGEAQTGGGNGRPDTSDKAALGVAVEPLTPELAGRVGVPRTTRGVVVDDVNPDGRAAQQGIQPGDVIESVNRKRVTTVGELREAVRSNSDRPLLLLINRRGEEVFLTVPAATS